MTQSFDFGTIFFNTLKWTNNKTTFNGLQFERNEFNTHFNATSIMDQCGQLLNKVSKRGLSSKNNRGFLNLNYDGRRIKEEGSEVLYHNLLFIPYRHLQSLLTYCMVDSYNVTQFFLNENWIDTKGYIYLNKITLDEGEIIYKYGRTNTIERRMNQYKNEFGEESIESLYHRQVNNMYYIERELGTHIFNQLGAEHVDNGKEYFIIDSLEEDELINYINSFIETVTDEIIESDMIEVEDENIIAEDTYDVKKFMMKHYPIINRIPLRDICDKYKEDFGLKRLSLK